jgi:hypothetical protein
MGERDAKYSQGGIVEIDDAFFGAPTEGEKAGVVPREKTQVLVELSLNERGRPLCVKMQVIPDVKGTTLVKIAIAAIDAGSTINSDALHS